MLEPDSSARAKRLWTRGAQESIIAKCVSSLCHKSQALGNIWVPVNGRLQTSTICSQFTGDEEGLAFFGERCREMTFDKGEGLPGRAWKTGQWEWVCDVQELSPEDYPRLDIAKACGVRASFTVPFVVCGTTLAVLEFVLPAPREEDSEAIEHVQKALSKALSFKVHQGMKRNNFSAIDLGSMETATPGESGAGSDLKPTLRRDNSEEDLQERLKYLSRPIQFRAASEAWAIRRKEVNMEKQLDEGSEGIVFTAKWRGMPVQPRPFTPHVGGALAEYCRI